MDAHHPYEPEEKFNRWGGSDLQTLQNNIEDVKWEFNGGQRPWWQRRALEALYDGCIRQLDQELEHLVGTLAERGELEDTLIVVTSDHGEGFGEPSRVRPDTRVASHSVAIHESLLHVPLVVKYPGQTDGKNVSDVVSLTDFPNAVEATVDGESSPDSFVTEGPVIATAHGLDVPVQERASTYVNDLAPYTATARAVYEGSGTDVRKYVTWRDIERTIAVRDAQTAWTVSDDGGERVDEAFEGISERHMKGGDMADPGEQSVQQLKDLGYM